jgi:hypothetical protein
MGRPEPLPTTAQMKPVGGSVEEEGSEERSSCDRRMEEAWRGGDETDGDDLMHIDGQCRLAEGRTRGDSLPLTALIVVKIKRKP